MKQHPKSSVPTTSKAQTLPTTIVGVNGIKNTVGGMIDSVSIPTIIDQPPSVSQRVDSGNGGSDEESNRYQETISYFD